jgi:hypothetical protein
MNTVVRRVVCVVGVLSTLSVPAAAQEAAPGAVRLAVTGTADRGISFNGTITINRFEERDSHIVAIGFVAGVLTRGSQSLGSGLAGEIALPVVVRSRGVAAVGVEAPARRAGKLLRVAWSPRMIPAEVVPLQDCGVLNVALAPATVNLLGVQVNLGAVSLDLTGVAGQPLGDLVCEASGLLGNVAGLVGVLNDILGLVTGLLGGLTGGIGGLPVGGGPMN